MPGRGGRFPVLSLTAPANSRLSCWPFVTEYKLQVRPPHCHMPRIGADIDAHIVALAPLTCSPEFPPKLGRIRTERRTGL